MRRNNYGLKKIVIAVPLKLCDIIEGTVSCCSNCISLLMQSPHYTERRINL